MLAATSVASAQGYGGTPATPAIGAGGGIIRQGIGAEGEPQGGKGLEGNQPTAPAPAWNVVPRIGIDEIFTDNVRETHAGRQADLISVISPGIGVTANTSRITGALDYSPQLQEYVNASDQDRLANNLFANGEAIVVPNLFFFDALASISQEDIAGGRGSTNSTLIPKAQRTQVIAYSATPAMRTNISSLANVELLYQLSQTYYTNTTTSAAATGLSNSTLQEGRFTLGTGDDFGRLHSALVADALHQNGFGAASSSNTGTSETRYTAEIDNEYQIIRSFSLIAQGGYEDLSFPGSSQGNFRGPIWAGGFGYHPNPDDLVRLLYGRRDGAHDFIGELRFAITPATKLYVTYSQQVETTQQAIIQGLGTAGLGPGGTIINTTNGLPQSVVNPNFPLQNDIFRAKLLQGGVISAVGRNTFTVTGFHDERISLIRSTPSETVSGGTFQWSREMDPRTTGALLVGYANDSSGSGATKNVSIGVNHAFTDSLSGGVRYDYINGSGGGLGLTGTSSTGTKFIQNALTLSLRKTF